MSEHLIRLTFDLPYTDPRVSYQDGRLVIELPFATAASAQLARNCMTTDVILTRSTIQGTVIREEDHDRDQPV